MDLQLQGKTALVTGGSKGIGAATASAFAREGCNLILVARSHDDLERTRDAIGGVSKVRIEVMAADLARAEEVAGAAGAFPDVDILVNNAGAIPTGTLDAIDDAAWRTAWDLKVFGYINMSRAYYAAMRQRGGGVIVNVIGAAANSKPATYICGVTANAALEAFTQTLGRVGPMDGIRVVAIHPGLVATERMKTFASQGSGAPNSSTMPFGRAASPEEIANAIAFLASPLSGYTSGTIISIDGGMTAT